MYHLIRDVFRRLRRDERGNIFVLFGASAIPLLLVMGGAVDIARYSRYKADLANAVDAAALALARQNPDFTEAQATTFVTNYVTSFPMGDNEFTVESFDVDKLDNGFLVTATGSMHTIFLPLGKLANMGHEINSMDVNVVAEVVNSSNRLELALVFDNTGSMNCGNTQSGSCADNWSNPGSSSRIYALKAAAHTLLDTLMPDGGDTTNIKIAMVPFEGAVNIGSTYATNPPTWVDWATNDAKAKYNGQNFGKYNFSTNATCTTGTSCKFVGHKWLYSQLTQVNSTVKWEGCVEMRAEPYDILDTPPNVSVPNTLFVPYFWPDEPDRNHASSSSSPYQYTTSPNTRYNSNYSTSNATSTNASYNYTYLNNYLTDKTAVASGTARPANAQKLITKYKYTSTSNKAVWHSGQLALATSFPYQSGPNFGCPRPIVPLTNTKSTIETAINNMVAFYSTGTFIPVGLVWGWHVLTPTEPFTQGITLSDPDYDQTVRAVVLFTDGENYITSQSSHNQSRYSGYNYTALSVGGTYRLGDDDVSNAMDTLDDKTATLCENVKNNGTTSTTDDDIRLYTITFGSMSSADEDLMRDCATVDDGEQLYFHAPTTGDLEDIFEAIGEDLSDIHLSM